MFVVNPESIDKNKKFYCANKDLKDFLVKKHIPYVSREESNDEIIWIYIKTDKLFDALNEWDELSVI